jgi:hypothetical protein
MGSSPAIFSGRAPIPLLSGDRPMETLRKGLSAPGLLSTIRQKFDRIPDPRSRSGSVQIRLSDALMSGLAVFGLKCPSLLQFDQQRRDPILEHNLRQLYGVRQVPCDTQLRQILDPIDPRLLRPAFSAVFAQAQRGKVLEDYVFFDGYYLLALDGTGFFASTSVSCPHCCVKKAGTDEERYYHQLLGGVLIHPQHKEVIPLAPEPIVRSDGQEKNDCERNAAKRLLADTRREHPHLPLIVVEDALAANAPHIETLQALDMRFILGVKPGSHYALFEDAEQALAQGEGHTLEQVDADDARITHSFRWVEDLALNDSHKQLRVHFLDYEQIGPKKTQHFTWITDLPLTPDTVYTIMRGGRCRWKIENETFNTLKNQGYHLEHNYGHGSQYLASVFAYLTMLAFLVDQLQKHTCPLFQQALEKNHSMRGLWDKMRAFFLVLTLDDWTQLFHALIHGPGRHTLAYDTS